MTRDDKILIGVLSFFGLVGVGAVAAAVLNAPKPSGPPNKRSFFAKEIGKLVRALDASPHGKQWWRQRVDFLERIAVKFTPYGFLLRPVFQAENDYFAGKIPKAQRLDYALHLALGN